MAPRLVAGPGAPALSWVEARPGQPARVHVASIDATRVNPSTVLIEDPLLLANWADTPAALQLEGGGHLLAYPRRHRASGRDYGLRLTRVGADGTPVGSRWVDGDPRGPESGFAVFAPGRGHAVLSWLDGREMAPRDPEAAPLAPTSPTSPAAAHSMAGTMTLRARALDATGDALGPSVLLDDRTCECCKLDAVTAPDAVKIVYRDRDAEEHRDVSVATWTPPSSRSDTSGQRAPSTRVVHPDRWVMHGCPVNGPAAVQLGTTTLSAWPTAASGRLEVRLARLDPADGPSSAPARLDEGDPAGRVHLTPLDETRALATWLEKDASRPGDGFIVTRVLHADGHLAPSRRVSVVGVGRDWGFPAAVRLDDDVAWIWTDAREEATRVTGVVGALADLPGWSTSLGDADGPAPARPRP